jgi:hypothetical protein
MAAASAPLFPVAIGGNKFIFTRTSDMAATYRQQLSLPTPAFRRRDAVAFGRPVVVFTRDATSVRTRLLRTRGIRMLRRSLPWRIVRRMTR